MKNNIIFVVLFLILLVGVGYFFFQKDQGSSENSSTVLNKEEDKSIQRTQYTSVKFPNGPTFEYRSDLNLQDNYAENKTFVFESNTDYAIVYVVENYSQSLFAKAGNEKISDETGSVEYRGTREFGKNILVEFEACGLDTCQNVFVLKGPKDQALAIEGNIDFINPDSIVFD